MKKNQNVSKNYNIFILCFFIALIFSWFAFKSGKQLLAFSRLSESAPAQIERLTVRESKKNSYSIWAEFTYTYQGKIHSSLAPLGRFFPNPWAAEREMQRLGQPTDLICWFSPKSVDKAVLIKTFPLNSLLSSIILAGILLYFCGVAFYFQKRAA